MLKIFIDICMTDSWDIFGICLYDGKRLRLTEMEFITDEIERESWRYLE